MVFTSLRKTYEDTRENARKEAERNQVIGKPIFTTETRRRGEEQELTTDEHGLV
jgi:hypothetical protein